MDPTTGPTDLSFTWLVSSDRAWEGDDRKEIDFGYHCHENPILIPRVHNIHIPEPTQDADDEDDNRNSAGGTKKIYQAHAL